MPWRRFAVANAAGASAFAVTIATLAALTEPTGAVPVAIGRLALGAIGLVAGWRSYRCSRPGTPECDVRAGAAGDDTAANDCPDADVAARLAARA